MQSSKGISNLVIALIVVVICEFYGEIDGVMVKIPVAINVSKVLFTAPSFPPSEKSENTRLTHSACPLESCDTENDIVEKGPDKVFENDLEQDDEADDSEVVYDDDIIHETTLPSVHDTSTKKDGESVESKVLPRLITVNVPAVPPRTELKNDSRPLHKIYSNYPTIRLADFARKIIFPEWIWTKMTPPPPIVKKSEKPDPAISDSPSARPAEFNYNETFVPVTTTRRPKGILERPTITFDNNMSRFLRLFTVVRFQNVPCIGPSGENGTCYHNKECADLGGAGTTPCAQGLGVCCLFYKSCGDTIHRNGTYFVDSRAAFARGVSTCNINIQKLSPSIKHIRLEFHTFVLQPPNAGNCESDRFLVSGQNTNNIIPILCGNNSGSHLYIETGTSQSQIQLSVMTTGEGIRSWSIQINQIEEALSTYSAPSHCLQHFEGTMGVVTSFNYDSALSPQYLNNLNYAICIRKEAGFCSITYTNLVPDGQYFPFQVVNADPQGNLLLPSGQAGVGIRNCPDDFIILNGIRLCGERLNDGSKSTLLMDDAPVTDATNGPFTVMVRTNEIDVGGGFAIYYRQNPCMSTAG
ncbi:hypothetical protein Ocin01_02497 [Orchesella cincta]|uniref:CUB domain-containing protein n=1 Tax=Orchesella cincta TaxID=48709 RepID=A0A1D2NFW9_ORCCI|nr:hypothetical protein Ocin01_02497 [Orchesella cincta]